MSKALRQSFFIPKPELTEQNVPDQIGRVHIVTGGYGGCGFELSKILYGANATVYVAGRSSSKASQAISNITTAHPASKGKIEFLELDLSDLKTIKPAVDKFLTQETRLDVLTNNAGVSMPPKGSKDAQGYELQLGTNCVGPFLLVELLKPILIETAKHSQPGTVRVTWAASLTVDLGSPKPGGMTLEEDGHPKDSRVDVNYSQSKAGNVLLCGEAISRWAAENGVVHVAWNPGNLNSDLLRHFPAKFLVRWMLYPSIYGAYTELFAALSTSISLANNGAYVIPWGRLGSTREDVHAAARPLKDGGTGLAAKFWDWCDGVTAEYR